MCNFLSKNTKDGKANAKPPFLLVVTTKNDAKGADILVTYRLKPAQLLGFHYRDNVS